MKELCSQEVQEKLLNFIFQGMELQATCEQFNLWPVTRRIHKWSIRLAIFVETYLPKQEIHLKSQEVPIPPFTLPGWRHKIHNQLTSHLAGAKLIMQLEFGYTVEQHDNLRGPACPEKINAAMSEGAAKRQERQPRERKPLDFIHLRWTPTSIPPEKGGLYAVAFNVNKVKTGDIEGDGEPPSFKYGTARFIKRVEGAPDMWESLDELESLDLWAEIPEVDMEKVNRDFPRCISCGKRFQAGRFPETECEDCRDIPF